MNGLNGFFDLQYSGLINEQIINYLQMWEMANAFQFPAEYRNDHDVTIWTANLDIYVYP